MKKFWKAVVSSLCLVTLLASCNSQPATSSSEAQPGKTGETSSAAEENKLTGDLVFWTQWAETEAQGEVIQAMADEFMTNNPGTNITIQWCGRDISKTLKPALEGGETIDLFEYPLQYGDQLKSFCLDLSDYTEKAYKSLGGKTLKESVLPMLLTAPQMQTGINDILVGVGYQPYMGLFMYNAKVMEELQLTPPSTWEEFDAVCAKIKDGGYSPITFDNAYALWMPGTYLAHLKGQDWVQQLVTDKTGELWKDEAVVKMAEAFEGFAKKGYFDANVAGNVYPAGQADVANGKAVIYYNGTWLPNEVADIAGPDFKWGAFNFPDVEEGANKYETQGIAGCGMMAVNANCKNPELAMEFLASFYTPENDASFVDKAKHISAIPGGKWDDALAAVKPAFESVSDPLKAAANLDSNADLQPVISENFIKLAAGQLSAEGFVNNMVAAAKQ